MLEERRDVAADLHTGRCRDGGDRQARPAHQHQPNARHPLPERRVRPGGELQQLAADRRAADGGDHQRLRPVAQAPLHRRWVAKGGRVEGQDVAHEPAPRPGPVPPVGEPEAERRVRNVTELADEQAHVHVAGLLPIALRPGMIPEPDAEALHGPGCHGLEPGEIEDHHERERLEGGLFLQGEADLVRLVPDDQVVALRRRDPREYLNVPRPVPHRPEGVADKAESRPLGGRLRQGALLDEIGALGEQTLACVAQVPVGGRRGQPVDGDIRSHLPQSAGNREVPADVAQADGSADEQGPLGRFGHDAPPAVAPECELTIPSATDGWKTERIGRRKICAHSMVEDHGRQSICRTAGFGVCCSSAESGNRTSVLEPRCWGLVLKP